MGMVMPDKTSSTESVKPPLDLPSPPDQGNWDKAAQEFQQQLLVRTQESAAIWSGAVSTLLGLFGTVALVTGPDDITKLTSSVRVLVIALTVAAGLLAGWSVVLATQAQTPPGAESSNWNGYAYRVYVYRNAGRVAARLKLSRILGATAAGLIFAVGVIALIDATVV